MAITRYVVAATPSSPEPKVISNLKSARTEADARAKLDRVDVTVTTEATGKLSYTAQGAPVQAAPEPAAPAQDEPETVTVVPEDEVEARFAEMMAADPEFAAMVNADNVDDDFEPEDDGKGADVDDDFEPEDDSEDDEPESDGDAPAPDIAELVAEIKAETPAGPDPERTAPCGCLVEKIIATGGHGRDCTEAVASKAKAQAVKKDPQPRPATARRTGTTGRRDAIGESVVPGWELLYDKPRQKAQVGRNAEGHALICTEHKTVHKLKRLVQERALRQGPRSAWCTECTG